LLHGHHYLLRPIWHFSERQFSRDTGRIIVSGRAHDHLSAAPITSAGVSRLAVP
jgi:hypothetical protein